MPKNITACECEHIKHFADDKPLENGIHSYGQREFPIKDMVAALTVDLHILYLCRICATTCLKDYIVSIEGVKA
jgi:hypothetical protein